MRYSVSGANTTALDEASAAPNLLLGKAIATGRILWLRSAWFYNAAAEDILWIMDTATSTATSAVTNIRFPIPCASGITTVVEFPAPGLKFSTACVVSLDGTSGVLGASVGIGKAGGLGYEE